jgi:hypothetical protein
MTQSTAEIDDIFHLTGDSDWSVDSVNFTLSSLSKLHLVLLTFINVLQGGTDVIASTLEHTEGLALTEIGNGDWDGEPNWQIGKACSMK